MAKISAEEYFLCVGCLSLSRHHNSIFNPLTERSYLKSAVGPTLCVSERIENKFEDAWNPSINQSPWCSNCQRMYGLLRQNTMNFGERCWSCEILGQCPAFSGITNVESLLGTRPVVANELLKLFYSSSFIYSFT